MKPRLKLGVSWVPPRRVEPVDRLDVDRMHRPNLKAFEGKKVPIDELCAQCGLEYIDGKVLVPAKPTLAAPRQLMEPLRRVA